MCESRDACFHWCNVTLKCAVLCCARLLFVYWVAYYAQWIQIKWRIFRCVFFFGANIVDSSRKWPPKWIGNLALKLKMFQVQFVFVVCSACWRLPFWMLKRSALNIFDNWILFFNFFFLFGAILPIRNVHPLNHVSYFLFFHQFSTKKFGFEMKFETNFSYFDFQQLIRREKYGKRKKKRYETKPTYQNRSFCCCCFYCWPTMFIRFLNLKEQEMKKKWEKRTISDGKSDGKIIYLISSLDLEHKI